MSLVKISTARDRPAQMDAQCDKLATVAWRTVRTMLTTVILSPELGTTFQRKVSLFLAIPKKIKVAHTRLPSIGFRS